MAVTGTITTRFIDENGIDLGKQLVEKDYLINLYPNLFPQFKSSGLYNWGSNTLGQLGDNTIVHRSSPVQTVAGGTNWRQVAEGNNHNVGLKSDGTVWTWGTNSYGQLGDGSIVHRSSPIQVYGGGTTWSQVSCGYNHNMAIKSDGTLWSWGLNNYGQLGDNSVANKTLPVQADIADPFFNYNTMLLTADSTRAGQNNTFVDSSSNNFTITRFGNTTQGTFSPFDVPEGYWSNYFTGTSNSNYLSVQRLLDSNVDITLECWIYKTLTDPGNGSYIAAQYTAGGADRTIFFITGGYIYMQFGSVGVSGIIPVPLNQWVHIAWVRSGNGTNNWSQYVNGVLDGQLTYTGTYQNTAFTIGATPNLSSTQFPGYISNLRLLKGTALYTSNFTPPKIPLTSITNTSLLTCQSNRFKDNSLNNFSITPTGDVRTTSFGPFLYQVPYSPSVHGGSGYFDSSGDELNAGSNSAFSFGTGAYTIEFWTYLNSAVSASHMPCFFFNDTTNGIGIYNENGGNQLQIAARGIGAVLASTTTLTANKWSYIVAVRSGTGSGQTSIFVDGSRVANGTDATNWTVTGPAKIGGISVSNYYVNGYISNLRVVKGTAVYDPNASTLTVPTAPLTAINNTALLLNFTNASIYDLSGRNNLETIGNAQVSDITKYGTGSMWFDGNGDYLTSRLTDTYDFGTGNFTIEMWIYPSTSTHQSACLISQEHISAQNSPISIAIWLNNGSFETVGNQLGFGQYNGSSGNSTWVIQENNIATISTGVWTHIALVRSGTYFSMYVNGVLSRVVSSSVSLSIGNTQYFIAKRWDVSGSFPYFNGYIDELRITKGIARYTGNFTPSKAPLPVVAGTSLLTSQNNRFIDNSANNFAITRYGDASVQPWSPFSVTNAYDATTMGGSAYFDGSGDYLSVAAASAIQFGTGDYTIDFWVYVQQSGRQDMINMPGTNRLQVLYEGTNTAIYINNTFVTGAAVAPQVNAWNHIAATRSGTSTKVFLNGKQLGTTATNSTNFSNNSITIVDTTSGATPLKGYLSSVRLVKGGALFTADFTPPTAPPTTTASSGTVGLLLNFTNGGIVDLTRNNNLETVGNAQVSTSTKKYGTGSVSFDGTGDYLSLPSNSVLTIGTGDFTVECWFLTNSVTNTNKTIIDLRDSNGTAGAFFGLYGSATPFVANSAGGLLNGSSAISTGIWYHYAVVRSGTTMTMYINGSSVGSTTNSTNFSGTKAIVGSTWISEAWNGNIDDLRITKGIARYTSNFTPPTAALGVDQYWNQTSLLLSGDGVNGAQNNTFIDSSTNNFTITRNGNTTQGSFTPFILTSNFWSNYFDGSGDYLTLASNSVFAFGTGDFTIEAWVYTYASSSQTIIDTRNGDVTGAYIFDITSTGKLDLLYSASRVTSSANVPTHAWCHVAVTRSSGTIRLFINGVLDGVGYYTSAINNLSFPSIGGGRSTGSDSITGYYFNGYISNFRLINGVALYTGNFTPSQVYTGTPAISWKNVSCGKYYTVASKVDGTVWTWGYNTNGQLGDATTIHRSSAVQVVSGGTTWQQVSAGYHSAGIKSDGTLWTWGRNTFGQLGDNTIVHKSYPVQAADGDPYYNYNVLLLNGNGTNGAQNNTFLDSSNNNLTITRNGNTTQGSFSPFSNAWSNYFSVDGQYLICGTSSNLALGAGDFTVELWLYQLSINANYACIMDWRTNGGAPNTIPAIFITPAGLPYLAIANGSSFTEIMSSIAIPLNIWTHMAFVRSGSNITIYMNGTQVASASNTTNLGTQTLAINDPQAAANYVNYAYFSNLRIVKGTAVYTRNFTPPTVPLTAIPGTVLLTCQDRKFVDNSVLGNTITVNGSPQVTNFNPFMPTIEYTTTNNGGSAYFDGTGDYLTVPTASSLQLGTSDFTAECYVYLIAKLSTFPCIFANYDNYIAGSLSLFAGHNSGNTTKYQVAINGATFPTIQSTTSIIYNSWTHIAVVRYNGTITLYINGVADGTYNASSINLNGLGSNWALGTALDSVATGYIQGYISNFRLIKGTALYTSNFTPPTTPLSLVPNTSLLLGFTNAAITDLTGLNDLETVGDAQVSTSVVKYGSGSLKFDGTGDYLLASDSPNWYFGTGNFTIEFWYYTNALTLHMLVQQAVNSGNRWIFYFDATNGMSFDVASSSSVIISCRQGATTGWSIGTWYHVALVRNGNVFTIYRNGTSIATVTDSDAVPDFAGSLFVGGGTVGGDVSLNGYIDDLRITKGIARYTAAFTPGPLPSLPQSSTNWKFVACGNYFTAATKTDGTLWTWGGNTVGQLGDNSTTNRSSPVQTIASATNWKQVSCGLNHIAALKTDGTVWTWGGNAYGKLGDNTIANKSSPVQTAIGGITWKQISAGNNGTAAILDFNY